MKMVVLPVMVFTITLELQRHLEKCMQALQDSPSGLGHAMRIKMVTSILQDSSSGHHQFNEDQVGHFSSPGQPSGHGQLNEDQDGHFSSPGQPFRTWPIP